MDAALPVDAARLDQRILGLAPIGAAVHAQRAADGAGNAAQEGEPGNAGFLRRARDLDVGHRGAGAHAYRPSIVDGVESRVPAGSPRPARRRRARSDSSRGR